MAVAVKDATCMLSQQDEVLILAGYTNAKVGQLSSNEATQATPTVSTRFPSSLKWEKIVNFVSRILTGFCHYKDEGMELVRELQ